MDNYIILPHADTTTTQPTENTGESDSERVIIPSNLTQSQRTTLAYDIIQKLSDNVIDLKRRINDYKKDVDNYKGLQEKQSARNIEIIGVFSAVLALLIIDTSLIKSAESFRSAIFLIIGMTASIGFFASMIHEFFSKDEGKSRIALWFCLGILGILTLVGIFADDWANHANARQDLVKGIIPISTIPSVSSSTSLQLR